MSQERLWELIAKKLSGEADSSELKELNELLRGNPDLHYPIQTITDLWHHKQQPEADPEKAFDRHMQKLNSGGTAFDADTTIETDQEAEEMMPQKLKRRRLILTATMLAAAIATAIFFTVYLPDKSTGDSQSAKSEVSTKYGSKTKLVLPDGSQVWLNAGSRLTYDKNFNANLREVVLAGEAYFDVVKDPSRPFIIHTPKIDIRVIGTAFNVKSYPEDNITETSLIRGSIEVTIKDRIANKIILKPNEKLVIANNDSTTTQTTSPKSTKKSNPEDPIIAISHLSYTVADSTVIETSWLQNKLIFRSETFEELAIKMERWYDVNISFSDPSLKKKKFTGIFENETIQEALEAMKLTTPFNYAVDKKDISISDNKPLILKK